MLFCYLQILYAFDIFYFPAANFVNWSKVQRRINNIVSLGAYDQLTNSISKIYKKIICKSDKYFLPFFSYSVCPSLCFGISLKAMRKETEILDVLAHNIHTANTDRYLLDFSYLLIQISIFVITIYY